MHGRGDNVHQRAILRQLIDRGHTLWLQSSWVSNYHDLIAGGALKVMRKTTSLRTQTKNAQREHALFTRERPPLTGQSIRIWYLPEEVRAAGSVLGAMCKSAGVSAELADFRMPVPDEWVAMARQRVRTDKPILVYRPLVERHEWTGCPVRNPDFEAYYRIFMSIRDVFHVVSIADLVPKEEWMVGRGITADQSFHLGEIEFCEMAGLFKIASMVYASPGWAIPQAQAVGTPVVAVFGGYENSKSFSIGARFAPYLPIDTIQPCECFSHSHKCNKRIDVDAAIARIREFASHAASRDCVQV
jgi:hypothetical protein